MQAMHGCICAIYTWRPAMSSEEVLSARSSPCIPPARPPSAVHSSDLRREDWPRCEEGVARAWQGQGHASGVEGA